MSAGRILRCDIFTEGHHLQVLSVPFLQGLILHQTSPLVLQEAHTQKCTEYTHTLQTAAGPTGPQSLTVPTEEASENTAVSPLCLIKPTDF